MREFAAGGGLEITGASPLRRLRGASPPGYNPEMTIESRSARPEELDRVYYVVAYSFSADRSERGRQQMMHVEELARPATVLLEDGEIVASLKVYPFTVLVNGAPVPMGGVSAVSCLPEARRKGHVGRLLRHALEKMRESGTALSALYTPHPALYRKYGWMTAASNVKYSWHPKRVTAYNPSAARGRVARVTEEDWPLIAGMYERYSEGRTGQHIRNEKWWKEAVFRRVYDEDRKVSDVAVWYDDSGDPCGYLSYVSLRDPGPMGSTKIWLREFVPLTGAAYQGLLGFMLTHDLADEIFWYGPADDPLAYAMDDAEQVKREFVDDMMLRVVDIEKAVAARPSGPGAPDGALTIAITDAAAPWNTGTWRIENAGGRLSAKKDAGSGDLAMEAATFAAVYDGYMKASEAVRSGLAEGDATAAKLADRLFASEYPPNGSDFF